MSINIRRVGEVADGSVTESKLAEGAVTTPKLAESAVTDAKIADGSVLETKIANLAISTEKLKANAVTLAKADNDVRLSSFIGDETEVQVAGISEVAVKEFNFVRKSGCWDPVIMRIIMSLKTNDSTYTAGAKIYVDDVEQAEMTSISETFEIVSADIDISALAQGKHSVTLKLYSDDPAGISYNDYVDALYVK